MQKRKFVGSAVKPSKGEKIHRVDQSEEMESEDVDSGAKASGVESSSQESSSGEESSSQESSSGEESSSQESSSGDSGAESDSAMPDVTLFRKDPAPSSPSPEELSESDEEDLAKKSKAAFVKAWTERVDTFAKTYAGQAKERRQVALASSSRDERTLARIGWILEKLKSKRVCVAVLMTKSNTLYVYANTIDDSLEADLKKLKKTAAELSSDKTETYDELLDALKKAAVSELRKKEDREDKAKKTKKEQKASRRLTKVLNFFTKYPDITFQVHDPKTDDKHAEMRAADAAVKGGEGSVGISKLCCGKCALALNILERTKSVTFLVLGAHLKTYDTEAGWPVPTFLRENDTAMKAFLGEKAFAIYKENRAACLDLMKTEKLASTSFQQTDLYSSEESEDEAWLADDEEEEDGDKEEEDGEEEE